MKLSSCIKLNNSQLFPPKIDNFDEVAPAYLKETYSQGLYQDSKNPAKTLEIKIANTEDGQGQGIMLQLRPVFARDDQTSKELNSDKAFDITNTQDSKLVYIAARQNGAYQLTGKPIIQEQSQVATFWDTTNTEFSFTVKENFAESPTKTDQEYLLEVKSLFGEWVAKVCS